MKKEVNGVLYDTDKAEKIGSYNEEISDYTIKFSTVYRQHHQLFIYYKIPSWKEEGIYLIGEYRKEDKIQNYQDYWEED